MGVDVKFDANGDLKMRPMERILETDWLSTACSQDRWKLEHGEDEALRMRVVRLECRHDAIVTGRPRRVHCLACQEIIDRGLDYHGFRELGMEDPLHHERKERIETERAARANSLKATIAEEPK